jgi:hypothetical protein
LALTRRSLRARNERPRHRGPEQRLQCWQMGQYPHARRNSCADRANRAGLGLGRGINGEAYPTEKTSGKLNYTEEMTKTRIIGKAEFKSLYGELPELPSTAFQDDGN